MQIPWKQLAYDIAERYLPYPVLLDKDHSIAKYFDAKFTPQTFLIDPSGPRYDQFCSKALRVYWRYHGVPDQYVF